MAEGDKYPLAPPGLAQIPWDLIAPPIRPNDPRWPSPTPSPTATPAPGALVNYQVRPPGAIQPVSPGLTPRQFWHGMYDLGYPGSRDWPWLAAQSGTEDVVDTRPPAGPKAQAGLYEPSIYMIPEQEHDDLGLPSPTPTATPDYRGNAGGGTIYPATPTPEPKSTDTVPAMLTPHEAVLKPLAADIIGRDTIRRANEIADRMEKGETDMRYYQFGTPNVPPMANVPPPMYRRLQQHHLMALPHPPGIPRPGVPQLAGIPRYYQGGAEDVGGGFGGRARSGYGTGSGVFGGGGYSPGGGVFNPNPEPTDPWSPHIMVPNVPPEQGMQMPSSVGTPPPGTSNPGYTMNTGPQSIDPNTGAVIYYDADTDKWTTDPNWQGGRGPSGGGNVNPFGFGPSYVPPLNTPGYAQGPVNSMAFFDPQGYPYGKTPGGVSAGYNHPGYASNDRNSSWATGGPGGWGMGGNSGFGGIFGGSAFGTQGVTGMGGFGGFGTGTAGGPSYWDVRSS